MTPLQIALALRDLGLRPHERIEISRPGEIISYPFPDETSPSGFGLMVRTTPGDPTTMIQWAIPQALVDKIGGGR